MKKNAERRVILGSTKGSRHGKMKGNYNTRKVRGINRQKHKGQAKISKGELRLNRMRHLTPDKLRIVTLNVWGLRTKGKREDLKKFLHDFQVQVGVITETHLLDHEAKKLRIKGYKVVDWDGKHTNKGGVIILVALGVSRAKIAERVRHHESIDGCSCLIYPYHAVGEVIRLTGVYVPPSADATPQMMMALTDSANQSTDMKGGVLSHLFAGDFNPYTWDKKSDVLFHEWTGEAGMWELSDPDISTHRKGSALDKFLLLPGTNIPEEWLPPESLEWGGVEDQEALKNSVFSSPQYYPAYTYPFPVIADHHPVMLTLKGGKELPQIPVRALRVSHLSTEAWAEKNVHMMAYLQERKASIDNCINEEDPTSLLQLLYGGIRSCFRGEYRSSNPTPKNEDPFLLFCKRHLDDPDYPLLMRAESEGDDLLKRKVINDMSRRSWQAYLSKVRPSNTSELFAYLAKEEGSKPRLGQYSCSDPLQDGQGTLRFTGREKCA